MGALGSLIKLNAYGKALCTFFSLSRAKFVCVALIARMRLSALEEMEVGL